MITMERKIAKIIFNKSGGTASKNGITNRITLPTSWVTSLGITQEERNVEMTLEEDKIIIKKVSE